MVYLSLRHLHHIPKPTNASAAQSWCFQDRRPAKSAAKLVVVLKATRNAKIGIIWLDHIGYQQPQLVAFWLKVFGG